MNSTYINRTVRRRIGIVLGVPVSRVTNLRTLEDLTGPRFRGMTRLRQALTDEFSVDLNNLRLDRDMTVEAVCSLVRARVEPNVSPHSEEQLYE